jgi:hypothetical protein
MGVRDLMKLLKTKAPTAFRSERHQDFVSVWVDTPLTVMAHYKKCQSVGILPFASIEDSMLRSITNFREMGIRDVHFVFDGRTRTEKVSTVCNRVLASAKYSVKTTPTVSDILRADLELCQSIISKLRVPVAPIAEPVVKEPTPEAETVPVPETESQFPIAIAIPEPVPEAVPESQAPIAIGIPEPRLIAYPSVRCVSVHTLQFLKALSLADAQLRVHVAEFDSEEYIARHCGQGLVSSIDSDVLAFGIQNVVQHLGSPSETWIRLSDVLAQMELSQSQFRWLCVLLGTDFNSRLKGKGPAAVLPAIKKPDFDIDTWARANGAGPQWVAEAKRAYDIFALS